MTPVKHIVAAIVHLALTVFITDALVTLEIDGGGNTFEENGNITLRCSIQPFTPGNTLMEFLVDDDIEAECTVTCTDIPPFPGNYTFQFVDTNGIFLLNINPLQISDGSRTYKCRDGINFATKTFTVTKVSGSIPGNDGTSSKTLGAIIGWSIGGGVFALIVVVVFLYCCWKRITMCTQTKNKTQNIEAGSGQLMNEQNEVDTNDQVKYRVVLRTANLLIELKKDEEETDLCSHLSNIIKEYLKVKDTDVKDFTLLCDKFHCCSHKTLVFDVCVLARTDVTETLQHIFEQTKLFPRARSVESGYVMRNKDGREKTYKWCVTDADVKKCDIPSLLQSGFVDALQSKLLEFNSRFLATIHESSSNFVTINVVYKGTGPDYENSFVGVIRKFKFEDAENSGNFTIMKEAEIYRIKLNTESAKKEIICKTNEDQNDTEEVRKDQKKKVIENALSSRLKQSFNSYEVNLIHLQLKTIVFDVTLLKDPRNNEILSELFEEKFQLPL